jgi:CRISPR-associated protein Cmr2
MPDAILIFTFSPIQSFIVEARRASGLHVGSQILVRLARAAAQTVRERQGTLIYPAELKDDVPNKLVARVVWEEAESIAEEAKKALLKEWSRIANTAKSELMTKGSLPDAVWHAIWERQTSHLWEIYWAAAPMQNRSYKEAYEEVSHAIDAAKHTRIFEAAE